MCQHCNLEVCASPSTCPDNPNTLIQHEHTIMLPVRCTKCEHRAAIIWPANWSAVVAVCPKCGRRREVRAAKLPEPHRNTVKAFGRFAVATAGEK